MIYRLKEYKGDSVPVPQLVFASWASRRSTVCGSHYVLATGITDPDKLCADLKLRSRITAESALSFWAGAGLLERYDENAAPSLEPSAPAPMTWQEIAAASRTDPMISSLIRLRADQLWPGFDPQGDGKAGQPLHPGWLCPGDGHALSCLHRQLRQTHAGGGGP